MVVVNELSCSGCGKCESICPAGAVSLWGRKARVNSEKCLGCRVCLEVCLHQALLFDQNDQSKNQITNLE